MPKSLNRYVKPLLVAFAAAALTSCGGSGNLLIPQIRPVTGGFISSAFGERENHPILGFIPGRHHDGYDFAVAEGSPVHASMDGEVVSTGWMGGYGNTVVLRHADGYETLYGHTQTIWVSAGQHVLAGQTIAKVGSTGLSTGPHLHYELRRNGIAIDPGAFTDDPIQLRSPQVENYAANTQTMNVERHSVQIGFVLQPDRPACEGGLLTSKLPRGPEQPDSGNP